MPANSRWDLIRGLKGSAGRNLEKKEELLKCRDFWHVLKIITRRLV